MTLITTTQDIETGLFITESAGTTYRQIKKQCYEIFEMSVFNTEPFPPLTSLYLGMGVR